MKSKSFDLDHASGDKKIKQNKYNHNIISDKGNKTFDFVHLYESASEGSTSRAEKKTFMNGTENPKSNNSDLERLPHVLGKKVKREPVDITPLTIEGPVLNDGFGGSTPRDHFKITSTPIGGSKGQKSPKVKSIMKVSTTSFIDDTMDDSILNATFKTKKRNKSVSFLLEENENIQVKKTKSNYAATSVKTFSPTYKGKKHMKKGVKDQTEKENNISENIQTTTTDNKSNKKSKIKAAKQKVKTVESETDSTQTMNITEAEHINTNSEETKKNRKLLKKMRKQESRETVETVTSETMPHTNEREKVKKSKKKKYSEKQTDIDSEEPVSKSRKKDDHPDVITDLKNLSIGENAHTLTNLLDEMTVADKDKRKKLKQKLKNKNKINNAKGLSNNEEIKSETDIIEKKKWKKKWNKGDGKEDSADNTIIVENLAFSLLLNYKKLLLEHFVKYGLIKSVGLAEMYPIEEKEPIFTTTINFYSDGAATEALKEDNTMFEGRVIRVRRMLPPTDTTLVVRSYGPLTPEYISSEFCTAGKIRNIRQLVKGKNSMATFFVEFDGRESAERALTSTADLKIGGKKIHLSRFEVRSKKSKTTDDQDNGVQS